MTVRVEKASRRERFMRTTEQTGKQTAVAHNQIWPNSMTRPNREEPSRSPLHPLQIPIQPVKAPEIKCGNVFQCSRSNEAQFYGI